MLACGGIGPFAGGAATGFRDRGPVAGEQVVALDEELPQIAGTLLVAARAPMP